MQIVRLLFQCLIMIFLVGCIPKTETEIKVLTNQAKPIEVLGVMQTNIYKLGYCDEALSNLTQEWAEKEGKLIKAYSPCEDRGVNIFLVQETSQNYIKVLFIEFDTSFSQRGLLMRKALLEMLHSEFGKVDVDIVKE